MAINLANLVSRKARSEVGIRTIANNIVETTKDDKGNILSEIINIIGKIGTSLVKGLVSVLLAGLSLTWAFAWGLVVSAATFLVNFNWNISDAELDKQVEQSWSNLYSSLGATLGNATGWLVCGVLPAASMFMFNEFLGLYVLKNVGEEALEELAGNISILIKSLAGATTRSIFSYLFKTVRNILYPDRDKNAQPWILSQKIEEKIETITDFNIRRLVEEYYEELVDACVEAGYVVANSVDSGNAMFKNNSKGILDPDKIVEIDFKRNKGDSR